MTPSILEAMKFVRYADVFMWFDLGFVDVARHAQVTHSYKTGEVPEVLHTQNIPDEIPLPFEDIGVVYGIGLKESPTLVVKTFSRFNNNLQVIYWRYNGYRLILNQDGNRSLRRQAGEDVPDLWFDGEIVDELERSGKSKHDILENATDNARRTYAMLYIELVTKKAKVVAHQPIPNPSNTKRVAKGKKPLFEWKVIDVTANQILPEAGAPTGRKHASPRRHQRRGHMRKYKSGKVTWVKPTMVGRIEFGYIHHSYEAAPKGNDDETCGISQVPQQLDAGVLRTTH